MKKNTPTWYGFTLSKKQSVVIYGFALIGFLIGVFMFVSAFMSLFVNYHNIFNLQYINDVGYIINISNTSMLFLILFIIFFFLMICMICFYTMSRCKKTINYYKQLNNDPQIRTQNHVPSKIQKISPETNQFYEDKMFCPNCGIEHPISHIYCSNCAYDLI